MLREGTHAVIEKGSYEMPPIFELMKNRAGLDEKMMYNTFNMGIGMVVAVSSGDAQKAVECFNAAGEKAYVIGRITEGEKGVSLC